jgi:hypothetical protein
MHQRVDLVVTLGGDGTVLWVSLKKEKKRKRQAKIRYLGLETPSHLRAAAVDCDFAFRISKVYSSMVQPSELNLINMAQSLDR